MPAVPLTLSLAAGMRVSSVPALPAIPIHLSQAAGSAAINVPELPGVPIRLSAHLPPLQPSTEPDPTPPDPPSTPIPDPVQAAIADLPAIRIRLDLQPPVAPEGTAIVPGSGFTGPTAQPAAIGTGPGSDENAIARWDVIPFQSFSGTFNLGVVAFHMNDIDRVEFSVNGGAWVSVTQMTLNSETGVVEYWAQLNAADFGANTTAEVRAVAYPKVGVPRVLESLTLYANLPAAPAPIYVSQNGSDSGLGTQASPFGQNLDKALDAVQDGGTIIITQPGIYYVGNGSGRSERNNTQWITVQAALGIDAKDIIIESATGDFVVPRVARLRWYGVGFDFSRMAQYQASPGQSVWFDHAYWTYSTGWTDDNHSPPITYWNNPVHGYVTDSHAYDGVYGFSFVDLVRNSLVERISGAAYVGDPLVINCTVKDFNGDAGISYHRDVFHWWVDNSDYNAIAYGVHGLGKIQAQIFNVSANNVKDIAFVNVDIQPELASNGVDEPNWGGPQWSQQAGAMQNILFRNIQMPTQRFLLDTTPGPNQFQAKDVVFQNVGLHWANYVQYIIQRQSPSGVIFQNCTEASLSTNAVTDLAGALTPTGVNLTWTTPWTGTNALLIFRSADGGASWTNIAYLTPAVTSYQDIQILSGTSYIYFIQEMNYGTGTLKDSDLVTMIIP
jgi:hypothetical protein